jgi:hypothetical protein
MYLDTLLKLALKDFPTIQDPTYENIVDSIVRMPGPTDQKRKFMNTSAFPTEASKGQAAQALKETKKAVPTVNTHTIEGIH